MSGATDIEVPEGMHIEAETPDAPTAERQPSPRELAMAAIAARAQEVREAEMRQGEVYDQEARDAGLSYAEDEPEPAPVPQAAPTPAPVVEAPAPVAAPVPQVRTVTVDGRQFTVSDQQYDELARMGMLTNVALHQYREQPAPVVAPEPSRPVVDPDRVREVVKKMQFGGEDDATAELTRLITDVVQKVPVAPAIDPQAIIHQATEAARQQAQLQRDGEVIRQEYADIFAHPQRAFLAKTNVEVIRHRNMQLGRQQSDLDIYREAGDMVRDAMSLPRPGNDVTPSPAIQAAPRTEVLERKRAAPRMTQAIDRRAPAPETPRAPSGSDIVDRMRASRGQASMR